MFLFNVLADGHGNTNGHIVSMAQLRTPNSSRYLGPAQRRYGDYFLTVLASPDLAEPEGLTKLLRQVQHCHTIMSGFIFVSDPIMSLTLSWHRIMRPILTGYVSQIVSISLRWMDNGLMIRHIWMSISQRAGTALALRTGCA